MKVEVTGHEANHTAAATEFAPICPCGHKVWQAVG